MKNTSQWTSVYEPLTTTSLLPTVGGPLSRSLSIMFSIIIRGNIEDQDIHISSDSYQAFRSNISSLIAGI